MKPSVIHQKTFAFFLAIIDFSEELRIRFNPVVARQVLRSGTSIGAMVRESKWSESHKDFVHKLSIALKEAEETLYWLEICEKKYLVSPLLISNVQEIIAILVSIVKTARNNPKK